MRILVTGGSGTLGSEVARVARERGFVPRVLSRQPANATRMLVERCRGDLLTGEGVPEALCDVDAVVHAARDDRGAVDVQGARVLIRLAPTAGVEVVALPSIVGCSDIPLRYYRRKVEAEELLLASSLPSLILRSTQFHEFVNDVLGSLAGIPSLLLLPKAFRLQSVAAREVAERIVDAVLARRTGRLSPLAGPEIHRVEAMATRWLEAREETRRILRVTIPGRVGRAFREGKATAPDAKRGSVTWTAWLEGHHEPTQGGEGR